MPSRTVLNVEIAGVGIGLPQEAVSNEELIRRYDLQDVSPGITPDGIFELSGIRNRYISKGRKENLLFLASTAVRNCLDDAGISTPHSVDSLLLGTTTSHTYRPVPGTHPGIQRLLGEQGFMIKNTDEKNRGCSSFVSALIDMYSKFDFANLESGIVAGADILSKITDYRDGSTNILMGDGAGAFYMKRTDRPAGLLGSYEATDGLAEEMLYAGGPRGKMKMDGREVFKKAVKAMDRAGKLAMEDAGVTIEDIALFVPHQANDRIIEAGMGRKYLNIEESRVARYIHMYGNTSSGSVPLAFYEARRAGRVKPGDLVLFDAFGAGMTESACVVEI